jgi:hypothetical protein
MVTGAGQQIVVSLVLKVTVEVPMSFETSRLRVDE